MVVKVFISGISGNKEVKKRQQRVLMILDSRNIKYEVIDIAEPCNEEQKDFMQSKSTSFGGTIGDPNPKHPLPPQIFNDDEYCGDYDQFDLSNEIDEMEKFLKMAPDDSATAVSNAEIKLGNGEVKESKEENGTTETEQTEKPAEDKTEADQKEDAKDGADDSKNEESAENEREKSVEKNEKKEDDTEATKEEVSEENGAGDDKADVENSKEENGKATDETKDEEKDGEAEEDEEEEE